jgi:uncharacterized protein YbjT (DUF2867 family)
VVLVSGATGNAGGAVVRALVAAGQPVKALVRPGTDPSRVPHGAEAAEADLGSAESIIPHLQGVDAVFVLSGYDGLIGTLATMRDAGVARVVLLSSSAAPGGDTTNAVARYHIESEQAVRDSGLAWTFLQPNSFMTNTLQWVPQLQAGEVIRAPFADVAVATIHPDDIGTVAAVALTSDGHTEKAYRLSGPESLTPGDRVAILARVLGRDLRFQPQSDEEARAEMSESMPSPYVDAFMSFFADGKLDESEVLPTVEQVTGRPPRTFAQWASEHADALR